MTQVVEPGHEVKTTKPGRVVKTRDDRELAVETWGDESGVPVVLFHGTPGCRQGPRPRSSVLYRLGVRLISYDRPGYGGSDRHPDRRVVDSVADVLAIMDELGYQRFAVLGRSGGGPHALACAAALPERVTRAAAMVCLAPSSAEGLDWFDGMTDGNVSEFEAADEGVAELTARLEEVARRTKEKPESILLDLWPELTAADRRVVRSPAVRKLLAETYVEALKHGARGWVDDVLAARQHWGFDLGEIQVPVRLWHGAQDKLSPVTHSKWLASSIPGAQLRIEPSSAHFGAVEALTETIAWTARTYRRRDTAGR